MEDRNQANANKVEAAKNEAVSIKTGAVGLDIGTSRIVMADGSAQKDTSTQLNAFVAVPSSEMAENVLKHKNMVYERNCKNLYVYGNDSNFFASFLNVDARRPMRDGLLNAQEEMSNHIMQLIIQRLLPRGRGKEMLYFSVPGKGEGVNGKLVYHEAMLRNFLQSLGYNARSINEGQAVVFSELQDENFTGIGISFGGGMCNVSVSFMSMPMITFSIPKGGDYIDRNVTEVLGEANTTKVRIEKEENLDLSRQPKGDLERALHIYYEDLMQSLIERLRAEFRASSQLPKIDRPMPIVLAGGTAKPAGFLQKFEGMLRSGGEFPIEISDVRMAKDPLTATAHGCYIAALSETK
ncbi:MAG TPA: cell division protein FtsA [Pyrinomonadaceae bacterium]|jgi:actin-like ATPase involved in cell morphogenesis|nr:cell division protein FtsA [Pyrinomonadaceae bacterium]